uniref:Lipoprotein n=1 Tax=Steinernema glaseri TaxID=37863 RepID=A0A1I7Z1G6_9BILA
MYAADLTVRVSPRGQRQAGHQLGPNVGDTTPAWPKCGEKLSMIAASCSQDAKTSEISGKTCGLRTMFDPYLRRASKVEHITINDDRTTFGYLSCRLSGRRLTVLTLLACET